MCCLGEVEEVEGYGHTLYVCMYACNSQRITLQYCIKKSEVPFSILFPPLFVSPFNILPYISSVLVAFLVAMTKHTQNNSRQEGLFGIMVKVALLLVNHSGRSLRKLFALHPQSGSKEKWMLILRFCLLCTTGLHPLERYHPLLGQILSLHLTSLFT